MRGAGRRINNSNNWGYGYTRDTYSDRNANQFDYVSQQNNDDTSTTGEPTYDSDTMEYTLSNTLLLLVEKMRCNRCLIDGPYQDGEECDDINICWKFWSHDAFKMDGGMMEFADGQGTLNINLQRWHVRAELEHFQSSNTSNIDKIQRVINNMEDPESHANRTLLQSFMTLSACGLLFIYSVVFPKVQRKRQRKRERAKKRKKNKRIKLVKFKNPFQADKKKRKPPRGMDRSSLLERTEADTNSLPELGSGALV